MIDTHSHLFLEEFSEDLPNVILRAKEVGVKRIYMPNIDDTTVEQLLQTCATYSGYCFPMIGFHPTSVDGESFPRVLAMKKWLKEGHPFHAIGEVGMDLYWDKTFLKEQQRVLDEQIQWALEYDLPLVLHCREAFPQLFEVMRSYKKEKISGIFHSFTGNESEVREILEDYPAFMIGINGVVTFKNSTLPQVLRGVNLSHLVLETDSPYLSPVPFRGKRNESSYIYKVAEKLSDVYEVPMDKIVSVTTENALKVFKRME